MAGKRHRVKKGRFALSILLLIAICLGAAFFFSYRYISRAEAAYMPEDTEYYYISVPSGSSTSSIARLLEDNGVIRSAWAFKLLAKRDGYDGKFQAGDYNLSRSMTAHEIMEALTKGHVSGESLRFTLPEGLTRRETAEKLAEQGVIASADDFIYITEAHDGTEPDMSAMGEVFDYFAAAPYSELVEKEFAEGFLMPNTYEVYAGSSVQDVMDTLLRQFGKVFTTDSAKRCEEIGYTPYEVLTIASIIEKEAKTDDDRALISSVIYNRLKKGQKLEICATVLYVLGENKGYVTYEDTRVESPYNTYLHDGLPPTPICSPGEKAIEAALYPADTSYYYYVVSEKLDGSHNFAEGYDEFLKYKAAYQKAIGQ